MLYSELTAGIAEDTGLTKADVDRVLDSLRGFVHAGMAEGGEVSLPGLGKFSTSDRAARKGRNPATGEEIDIAAKRVVKFGAAKALKDAAAG